ncbi:kinase-like protein [Macrolepiota fuliginosa MF-IS2]|uniref:Kinase-like protein n=1 Tax=Macrolepiota fuliginosa MF-IS2 TaxID=1400762 RepID=A0A9P6C0Y3_9AGAR|nr:kinase-like protein [Macrolepiota fuliginosa MF-IS2]
MLNLLNDMAKLRPSLEDPVRKAEEVYFAYGDHSDVYKGYYRGKTVTIKRFRGVSTHRPEMRAEISQQLQADLPTWKGLNHPNICRVHKIAEGFGFLPALVMDYFPKGSIMKHIQKHNPSVNQRIHWVSEIADGLSHLHASGVYHSDLRGANVFLDSHNHAVVTDYGIAPHFNNSDFTSAGSTGIVRCTAPEVIAVPPNPNIQPEKIDIFAFGMTMLEIFSGQPPYANKSDVAAIFSIREAEVPDLPYGIMNNSELRNLFSACTQRRPEARPTAQYAAELLRTLLQVPGLFQSWLRSWSR